jgi:hypothetical protein
VRALCTLWFFTSVGTAEWARRWWLDDGLSSSGEEKWRRRDAPATKALSGGSATRRARSASGWATLLWQRTSPAGALLAALIDGRGSSGE